MPTLASRSAGGLVIRLPVAGDAEAFIAAARASARLHGAWVAAPSTRAQFNAYLRRYNGTLPTHVGFLVQRSEDGALCGVFNLSEIVRGVFHSAYLGYYAFAPFGGQGYMRRALPLVLAVAFRDLKLHRVEANAQPANMRSIRLLEQAGFVQEGYSRRYIKLGGRWRDHVRYALLAEEWRGIRKR